MLMIAKSLPAFSLLGSTRTHRALSIEKNSPVPTPIAAVARNTNPMLGANAMPASPSAASSPAATTNGF